MPTTYEELLAETLPARIHTDDEYGRIHARFAKLFAQRRRTKAEDRLMNLLGVLIQHYDHRNPLQPDDSAPAERLQHALETSGKKPSDLAPVFGQRSHIYEALTGKRPISAAQARKLGEMFHLKPGYFL
jgi:antitoxin component HigA of HigAB toxin-antitoxin module